ncbi:MAG TPA: hypothetical protein VFE77_08125, partial [Rhodanobacter sp.]|nr:hypothetical protein [Rhodanobacter sp.]
MIWFNNLKTSTKLVLGLGLIMALLGVMWGTAQRAMEAIVQSRTIAVEANALDSSLNADRALVLTLLAVGDATTRNSLFNEAAENARQAAVHLRSMRDLGQGEP